LQGVLAHEVAHEALDRRYGSDDVRVFRRSLIREFAYDLLAATVEGHGYLLALFEEIVGTGLEVFFDRHCLAVHVDPIDFLSGWNGPRKRDRNWIANLQRPCRPGSGVLPTGHRGLLRSEPVRLPLFAGQTSKSWGPYCGTTGKNGSVASGVKSPRIGLGKISILRSLTACSMTFQVYV